MGMCPGCITGIGETTRRGSAEIFVDEWTHIAFRYELGQQAMFINGELDASANAGPLNSIADIIIGGAGRLGENRGFTGLLDEVVIYNTALAGNQILALAENMPPDMLPAPDSEISPPVFFSLPFGEGGTWNVYELVGTVPGRLPDTWFNAHNAAIAKVDPLGGTSEMGHLAHTTSLREALAVAGIARGGGSNGIDHWVGLTDHSTLEDPTNGFTNAEEADNDPGSAGWTWVNSTSRTTTPAGEPDFILADPSQWVDGQPDGGDVSGVDEDAVYANGDGLLVDDIGGFPGESEEVLRVYVIEWDTQLPEPPSAPANPDDGTLTIPMPVVPESLVLPDLIDGLWAIREYRNSPTELTSVVSSIEYIETASPENIFDSTAPVLNHSDFQEPGTSGSFVPDLEIGDPAVADNDLVTVARAQIEVPAAGIYTFRVRSDDGFAVKMPGRIWSAASGLGEIDTFDPSTLVFNDPTADSDTRGTINLEAGPQEIILVSFERAGGYYFELTATVGEALLSGQSLEWRLVGDGAPGTVNLPQISAPGFSVRVTSNGNGVVNNIESAEALLSSENPVFGSTPFSVLQFADPDDPGNEATAFFDRAASSPFPGGEVGVGEDNFAFEATATFTVPADGFYRFGFNGDDGGFIEITNEVFRNYTITTGNVDVVNSQLAEGRIRFDGNTPMSSSAGDIELFTDIEYELRVLFYENAGGAFLEVFAGQNGVHELLRFGGPAAVNNSISGLRIVGTPEPVVPFMINTVSFVDGEIIVTWDAEAGRTYTVERATDLTDFTVISDAPIDGVDGVLEFRDAVNSPPDVPRYFYRVIESALLTAE